MQTRVSAIATVKPYKKKIVHIRLCESWDPSSSDASASPVPSPGPSGRARPSRVPSLGPSGPAHPSSVPANDYIFDRIPDLVEVLGTLQDDGDDISSSPINETGNDATIPVQHRQVETDTDEDEVAVMNLLT
ncbi:hypothetical protein [Absidia glauca]|uniref:Uncharacterized protein n=1 Tax=Absidia glauca TaxID=4829 RepID=A0A163J9F1_ABSGL|nr:hypothetical protein [Absidia glauca]